jgi:hypothetical protein
VRLLLLLLVAVGLSALLLLLLLLLGSLGVSVSKGYSSLRVPINSSRG